MPKVRVNLTMFAEPVEVDEEELPGLRAQGLLVGVQEEPPAPSGGSGGDGGGEDDSARGAAKKPRGSAAQ